MKNTALEYLQAKELMLKPHPAQFHFPTIQLYGANIEALIINCED